MLGLRASLQSSFAKARETARENAASVAGVYFDQGAGGVLTVATTPNAPADAVLEIESQLPTVIAHRLVTVPRSRQDLELIQSDLVKDLQASAGMSTGIVSVGIDAMHDVVAVTVVSDKDGAAIEAAYGESVVIEIGEVAPAACSTVYNCVPIKGGLEMLNPVHPGYEQCTTGFNARPTGSSSTLYIVSAGHCWQDASDKTFVHNGNQFGTATFSPFQRTTGSHYSDSLLVKRNAYGAGTPINSIFIPNDTNAYTITGKVNLSQQDVGDYVCNTGVNATHARCGYITIDNDVVSTQPGGRWGSTVWTLYGQERANFATSGGDSGGPVYITHDAYGIVWAFINATHSEYSAIDQVFNDFDDFGGYGVRLCLNSSCS